MRINIFITGLLIFILPGISGFLMLARVSESFARIDYIEQITDEASMNWTTQALRIKGYGYGPENVKHLGRRKILTKRAAKVDAYRNLVEVIKGVQVTSNSRVEDMMLESDSIQTKTRGMLKGMKVVDVTYSHDGGCEITVEVNIYKDGTFLLADLNTGNFKVTDNYPKFDWDAVRKELEKTKEKLAHLRARYSGVDENIINSNHNGLEGQFYNAHSTKNIYTGLLVDARELDLKPTLAPSILNQNREKMYGIGVIPTKVTNGSTADYLLCNIEHARKYKKISDWPLVVKGIEVINETDVIIDNEDAKKLLLIHHLLEQGKVVILIKG